MIGIARTGSGKTLAFILPMLRHIIDQPSLEMFDGPIALLLTPTRELALQTYKEIRKFTKSLKLSVTCVYGGAGVKEQIADLKRGTEIVVCTPGESLHVYFLCIIQIGATKIAYLCLQFFEIDLSMSTIPKWFVPSELLESESVPVYLFLVDPFNATFRICLHLCKLIYCMSQLEQIAYRICYKANI